MRKKLLTLIKRLGEFTLCDLVIFTEIEESIVKAYLKEFLNYGIIKTKCCNRYVFLKFPDIRMEIPVIKVKLSEVLNTYIEKWAKTSKPCGGKCLIIQNVIKTKY